MAEQVADRLRDALERLDQAIDRLEALVPVDGSRRGAAAPSPLVAERLDRLIARIEAALVE